MEIFLSKVSRIVVLYRKRVNRPEVGELAPLFTSLRPLPTVQLIYVPVLSLISFLHPRSTMSEAPANRKRDVSSRFLPLRNITAKMRFRADLGLRDVGKKTSRFRIKCV